MQRIPEPELMNDPEQAAAYARADFSEPHQNFVRLFAAAFPELHPQGLVLDLGCGPADVTIRFAAAYPACSIHGVDAAENMLQLGQTMIQDAALQDRIRLILGRFPDVHLPAESYELLVSNSLLHHLADPLVLWQSIKRWGRPSAPVFVMDLIRPDSAEQTTRLTRLYASGAPEVLRRDFENSLRAAYSLEEVEKQLHAAGLPDWTIRRATDRHLVVYGRLPL
jgi:ubiquinone/menaquinone biosynthesis C-methylase UbiE